MSYPARAEGLVNRINLLEVWLWPDYVIRLYLKILKNLMSSISSLCIYQYYYLKVKDAWWCLWIDAGVCLSVSTSESRTCKLMRKWYVSTTGIILFFCVKMSFYIRCLIRFTIRKNPFSYICVYFYNFLVSEDALNLSPKEQQRICFFFLLSIFLSI